MMPICPGRRSNQIVGGISTNVETPANQINIGITPEQIDCAGDLTLKASGGDLIFDDQNRPSSSWAAPMRLAENAVEWDDLETAMGAEQSLVKNITDLANEITYIEGTALPTKATVTTQSMAWYVNFDSGSDANDGLTISTPKRTIAGLDAIIPDIIKHNSTVYVDGTMSSTVNANIANRHVAGVNLVICGPSDNPVDLGGGSKTVSSSTTFSLTVSPSPGWTTNQYQGMWCYVTSGSLSGYRRVITSNTADTINFACILTPALAAGTTFTIGRPRATFDNSVSGWFSVYFTCTGSGNVYLQNLSFIGTKCTPAINYNQPTVYMSTIYSDCAGFYCNFNGPIILNHQEMNPSTYALGTSRSTNSIAMRSGSCALNSNAMLTIYAAVLRGMTCLNTSIFAVNGLYSIGAALINGIRLSHTTSTHTFESTSNYIDCRFGNATGVGLTVNGVTYISCDKLLVESNSSHGIDLNNSTMHANNVISGSSNTGAGAYVHNGSKMTFASGYTPAVTGTVGDVAMSSPSAPEDTWANIDAAGKIVVANELSMITKV